MAFRSFQHNYHEARLTRVALGPGRQLTLEVRLNASSDKSASAGSVRLDGIENFEEVRAFLGGGGLTEVGPPSRWAVGRFR